MKRRVRNPQIDPVDRPQKRALSIAVFCETYAIGRTTVYSEIKSGRLRAKKCGKRTIITDEDGQDWLRNLPPSNEANPNEDADR